MHWAASPSTHEPDESIVMQNIPIVAPQTQRTVSRGHGKI